MKISSILILLLFASTSVLSKNMSKAEMCMFDSVLSMTSTGQKIAFKLTKTYVSNHPFKLPKGAKVMGTSTTTHTKTTTVTKKDSFQSHPIDKNTGVYDKNTKNSVPSSVTNKGPINPYIFDRDWETYTELSDNWVSQHGGWTDFCFKM